MRFMMAGLLGLCFSLTGGQGVGTGECDLKTVVKGFYCETDDQAMLAADLVSNVAFYVCEECGAVDREPGDCPGCETPLVARKSGKNVCRLCLEAPVEAEVCTKVYFACPGCEAESPTEGMCETCEEKLEKKVSSALVEYRCSACSDWALKPGKCSDEECEMYGKPLARICSESGRFPHVGKGGSGPGRE